MTSEFSVQENLSRPNQWCSDYHIHTSFSDDSESPMKEYVKVAIEKMLDEICFTEHIDYGVKSTTNCNLKEYREEFLRCQSKYQNQIQIKYGIEFGVQTQTIDEFLRTFSLNKFDFVILSCHQKNNLEFWNYQYQNSTKQKDYIEDYYNEILEVIQQFSNYSVIGHLDMIRRYDSVHMYLFEKVEPIIRKILQQVIADGKGIEINGSYARYGLGDWMPSKRILKMYHEMGGEIITFGTDAHQIDHILKRADYNEIFQTMQKIGYKAIYTFEEMKPIRHMLE